MLQARGLGLEMGAASWSSVGICSTLPHYKDPTWLQLDDRTHSPPVMWKSSGYVSEPRGPSVGLVEKGSGK